MRFAPHGEKEHGLTALHLYTLLPVHILLWAHVITTILVSWELDTEWDDPLPLHVNYTHIGWSQS